MEPEDSPRPYRLLARMRFWGYLTTNYDALLIKALTEHARGNEIVSYFSYPHLPVTTEADCPIFHLHGLIRIEDDFIPENVVLKFADGHRDIVLRA